MTIFFAVLLILFLYGVLSIIVHYYANFALFKPQTPTYQDDESILKIPTANGLLISARYLCHPTAHYTILFSHGNRADIGLCMPLAESFYQQGFSILVYDYPGYGTSTGKVSEANTYAAINAVYEYLVTKLRVPATQIILYGRSLGGGPSIELATQKEIAGLIVEGTFTSVYHIKSALAWLPFDKFQNLKKIEKIHVSTLIIHGELDTIIPLHHGQALYMRSPAPKMALWMPNAEHHNVIETGTETFWKHIHNFVNHLQSNLTTQHNRSDRSPSPEGEGARQGG